MCCIGCGLDFMGGGMSENISDWDQIHLDPKERLYWALKTTKNRKSDLNWHHASHTTCVGSTHGRKICEYLGVDPDGTDFTRKL